MRTILFDCEANGLLDTVTTIHVIVCYDLLDNKVTVYDGDKIEGGVRALVGADRIVAHNSIGYDVPLLKKLYGVDLFDKCEDTYILSQMFYPNEMQKHSIDAWGDRFGIPKPVHEDWTTYSPEMRQRCIEDVKILYKLWKLCDKELKSWDWEQAKKTEYQLYHYHCQHQTSWPLDVAKAEALVEELTIILERGEIEVQSKAPPVMHTFGEKTVDPFLKSGGITKRVQSYFADSGLDLNYLAGQFCKVAWSPLNLNSAVQVTSWLLGLGWNPDELTPTGAPSLRNSSYTGIPEDLKELLILNNKASHRRATIQGFLNRVDDSGRIPTFAYTCGTNCVTGDTLITTDTGLIPIVDVNIGDLVLTHQGKYERVTDKIFSGVKDVYRVVLDTGNIVNSSYKHPYLSKSGEWVRAIDLKPGDEVYILQESEEWKSNPEYPNYLFSSWGRILNTVTGSYLDYTVSTSKLRRRPLRDRRCVDIVSDQGSVRKSRGRLILETFSEEGGDECRHLDGNPSNNYLNNLAFGTSKDNTADQLLHGRLELGHRARGKLLDTQVEEIRSTKYYRGLDTFLAGKFGVSRSMIGAIRRGERYKKPTDELYNRYRQPFKLAKVVSVTKENPQPLYDITVDKDHSFIGNGVVLKNTARYRHVGVVNLPKADEKVFYGKELRSLFICEPGYVLVGCDASALEARVEGHTAFKYDNGEYARFLLHQDIHQFNADSFGISRNKAKTVGYAMAYQCSWKKIDEILGCGEAEAKRIHAQYWKDRPAISAFIKSLEDEVTRRGFVHHGRLKESCRCFIKGIDGRKLFVRAMHSLKNTYIQNAGMMAMKLGYVHLARQIEEKGLDARIVMMYHDEYQVMCRPDIAEEVGRLASEAIQFGGECLNLHIPLEGEYKIGTNWAETH